ncbi:MAG: VOC family protein [Rhizobacter sp.]
MSTPTIEAYLNFNGNCAEAMRFYEKTIGGKLEMMMKFSESPDPEMCPPAGTPADVADRILHASLLVGTQRVLASDTMPGQTYEGQKGIALAISYPTVDEARKVFDTFATGGRVDMPLSPTFWAEAFGSVVDRFGTCWLVNGGPKEIGA